MGLVGVGIGFFVIIVCLNGEADQPLQDLHVLMTIIASKLNFEVLD